MKHDPAPVFTCCECGRPTVALGGAVPEPPFCGACLHEPGWTQDDRLREAIDRHYGDPAAPARWAVRL